MAVTAAVLLGAPGTWWSWLLGAALLVLLAAAGEHRDRLTLHLADDLPRLGRHLLGGAALVALGAASWGWPADIALRQLLGTAVTLLLARAAAYALIRARRRRGRLVPAVIVGSGAVGLDLARLLGEHPEHGLRPVGVVDDQVDDLTDVGPVPWLGRISDLRQIIRRHGVAHVIVAFSSTREHDLVRVLRDTAVDDVALHTVPRFFELGLTPTGSSTESVWGIPLYRVRRAALRGSSLRVKRFSDAVVAGAALLVLAPLVGVIALTIKATSPGPVLFRQRRVGQHGRQFELLKFRTMQVNDDADVTWSVADDDRCTRVGRILRATALDELPQLWNVLVGDMSLVGPRPERPFFVDRFGAAIRGYDDRHRLPVGLTGLAQVQGLRGDTSIEERARFDNYYVEHWSPWLDLKIIVRTPVAILKHAGASRRPKPAQQQVTTVHSVTTVHPVAGPLSEQGWDSGPSPVVEGETGT
jgi:exopolysaccharide biosynthesis polyprenyl glycosylphosphotransferase